MNKIFVPASPVPNLFKLQSLEVITICAVYLPLYNKKIR